MAGMRGLDLRGLPLNPNPDDRFYGGSIRDYATRGPVPSSAISTLGYCGVRRWPGDDETDGFIRYVAGVAVERTARSMLFVCVDVKVHGPITTETVPRLENAQAFDWYRRKHGTYNLSALAADRQDMVPISAWSAQLEAAAQLDKSLLLICRSGLVKFDIVAWNSVFSSRHVANHELEKCKLSLRLSTRSTGDADWIETDRGTLVVFAWLEADEPSAGNRPGPKRSKTSHAARPVPLLLEAVDNWNLKDVSSSHQDAKSNGPDLFCVGIVAEQYYHHKLPIALWLWFPAYDATYIVDEMWRRLGYEEKGDEYKTDHLPQSSGSIRYPPHEARSWLDVIDATDMARVRECLTRMVESQGSDLLDLKVTSTTKQGSRVKQRWRGLPILWTKDKSALLAMAGFVSGDTTGDESAELSLAANVSREVQVPLGALRGSLEHLWTYRSDDAVSRTLHDLLSAAVDDLESTVDDVVDLSKLGAESSMLKSRPTSIRRLLSEVRSRSLDAAAEKRQMLAAVDVPIDFPVLVYVDRERIGQIYANCLSAAIRLTEEGGTIRTVVELVQKTLDSRDCHFIVRVVDSGSGVPTSEYETLFEKSVGLAISRRLATLHHAKLYVRNAQPTGTALCLEVSSPFVPDHLASEAPQIADNAKREADVSIKLHAHIHAVLLCDSNQAHRTLLELHLRKLIPGVHVAYAADEVAALDVVSDTRRHTSFDLVFMDLKFPNLGGVQAAKILLRLRPQIRIIGMTNDPDTDSKLALSAGVRAVFLKPTSSEIIRTTITRVLDVDCQPCQPHSHRASSSTATVIPRSPSRDGCFSS